MPFHLCSFYNAVGNLWQPVAIDIKIKSKIECPPRVYHFKNQITLGSLKQFVKLSNYKFD